MTISGTKYLLKHRKKTIGDKINKSYEDHLKKGSFNFHEESFSVIDLDTKIVKLSKGGLWEGLAAIHTRTNRQAIRRDQP